jgi:mevalonate kinase
MTVSIESDLPTSAGLASSAAVTVASIRAIAGAIDVQLDASEAAELASRVELEELNTGAGPMDFYSCAFGGLSLVDCGTDPPSVRTFDSLRTDLYIVIGDSGRPHDTQSSIAGKRRRLEAGEPDISWYADHTRSAVARLGNMLQSPAAFGDHEIWSVVTECHVLIRDFMKTSTPLLDRCVQDSIVNGAYGAKLSGSGLGGCMFAIADVSACSLILSGLERLGVSASLAQPSYQWGDE